MSVIVQHYYLAVCDYCGQENEGQFMTESSAKNALREHYVSEHGPATDRENGSIEGVPVGGDPSFGQRITIRENGSTHG